MRMYTVEKWSCESLFIDFNLWSLCIDQVFLSYKLCQAYWSWCNYVPLTSPVDVVSCTNIWVQKDSLWLILCHLKKNARWWKKPCSVLASQWSGTYVHRRRVHTRGGREGYRGTTCAGGHGVSRQAKRRSQLRKWEMSGYERLLRVMSIEMEKPQILHSCVFSILELFNGTGCRQRPAGRYWKLGG